MTAASEKISEERLRELRNEASFKIVRMIESFGQASVELIQQRDIYAELLQLRAEHEELRDALKVWLPKCGYCGGSGRELTWDMKGGPPMRTCTYELCVQSRKALSAAQGAARGKG